MEIEVGMSHSITVEVVPENTAAAAGSGLLEVFATPHMIALMERAAGSCIQPGLDEGQSSVGTKVSVEHMAATPVGMRVTATATVTEVDRRRVEFRVSAKDEAGEVGFGTHTRFVVDSERFMQKAAEKKLEYGE